MTDRRPSESSTCPERPRTRVAHLLPVVLVVGFVLAAAAPADARIYKYVDRDGKAHFTDSLQQVPMEYRSQVRDISPELSEMDGLRIVPGSGGSESGDAAEADDDATVDWEGDGDFGVDAADGEMIAGLLESFGFAIILLALLAIPVVYVVSALVFKLSCRLAGEDPPGLGRACGILLAQGFAGGAVSGAVSGIAMAMGIDEAASIGASVAVTGAGSLLSWMVNAAILSSMMSYGFVKSMAIGFLHTLLSIVMIGGPIAAVVGLGLLLA